MDQARIDYFRQNQFDLKEMDSEPLLTLAHVLWCDYQHLFEDRILEAAPNFGRIWKRVSKTYKLSVAPARRVKSSKGREA